MTANLAVTGVTGRIRWRGVEGLIPSRVPPNHVRFHVWHDTTTKTLTNERIHNPIGRCLDWDLKCLAFRGVVYRRGRTDIESWGYAA